MPEQYEDENDFDREDELEDEDGLEDETEDGDDGEEIDLTAFLRQRSEAEDRRIPIRLGGTRYMFLPPDRWPLSVQSALDGGNDDASVHRWIKGVLKPAQATKFIDLDPDMELIGEVVKQLQERTIAQRKQEDKANKRSGNPAKRSAAGRGKSGQRRR